MHPPALTRRPDGGVTLTFFTRPVEGALQPSKGTVFISPTYEVVGATEVVK